jgi:ComF family protein
VYLLKARSSRLAACIQFPMKLTAPFHSLLHLFFPHCCAGCGSDILQREQVLCLSCISQLPLTNFHLYTNNPVENIFRGRILLLNATSYCYFTKDSLLQHLMHQFKYKNRKELGLYFGRRMGEALLQSTGFIRPDALVPVPLFTARERKRGYNQAGILCTGMAEVMDLPIWHGIVTRHTGTQTQTDKSRMERWQNIEGRFSLHNATAIQGKHLLLVDDVVTTGATLEACGQTLLAAGNVTLSIATLAFTTR